MSTGIFESLGNAVSSAWHYVRTNAQGVPTVTTPSDKRAQATEDSAGNPVVQVCAPPCSSPVTISTFPSSEEAQTMSENLNSCLKQESFYQASFSVSPDFQITALGCSAPILDLSSSSQEPSAKKAAVADFFYNIWSAGIFQPKKEKAAQQAEILEGQIGWRLWRDVRLKSKLTLASLYLVTGQYEKSVAIAEEIINFPLSVTSRRPMYADDAVFLIADAKNTQATRTGNLAHMQTALDFLRKNYQKLGNGEVGFLRRYSYEMYRTCVDAEEQFGAELVGCSEPEMAGYLQDATVTYNSYAPFFADNFIATKALLQEAKHRALNSDVEGARQGYQDVLDLIEGFTNPMYLYHYRPDLAKRFGQSSLGNLATMANLLRSDEQSESKYFQFYQAQAYQGLAATSLADSGETTDQSALVIKIRVADFWLGRAQQTMTAIKQQGNYDFYTEAMSTERQTYYDVLANRAEVNLNLCFLTQDDNYCQAAERYAGEVVAYYQTRERVEHDPEAAYDISNLKSLLVLGEAAAVRNQAALALQTFRQVTAGIARKKEELTTHGTPTLPPYYAYLQGRALVKESAILARQTEPDSTTILTKLAEAEFSLWQTLSYWERTAAGRSFLPVIARLQAETSAIQGETYIGLAYRAQSATEREVLLAQAEAALALIPDKHSDLHARAEIRRAEIMLSTPLDELSGDPFESTRQVLAALALARQIMEERLDNKGYYTAAAVYLQGKALVGLSEYYLASGIEPDGQMTGLLLSANLEPELIASTGATATARLARTAYQIFQRVPTTSGYLADAAAVERNSLVANYPKIFAVSEADPGSLDRALASRDSYLSARAALAKGALLLRMANEESAYSEQAAQLRKEALALFVAAEALLPYGDYLQAKATVFRASLIGMAELGAEDHEIAQTLLALPAAQALMDRDSYLWSQAELAKGELNLALADRTPDRQETDRFLTDAATELATVAASSRFPDLQGRATVLRGSIIARRADSTTSPDELEAVLAAIATVAGTFPPDSYFAYLTRVVSSELNLRLADRLNDPKYLERAERLLASGELPAEHEYLYHRAALLSASIKTRKSAPIGLADLTGVDQAIAYFSGKGSRDRYSLSLAYTTLGELALRAADNPAHEAEALALFTRAEEAFRKVGPDFSDLRFKALVQRAAFIARKPQMFSDQVLAASLVEVEEVLASPLVEQSEFLWHQAQLAKGDLLLGRAKTDPALYSAAYDAYAQVGESHLPLYAEARLQMVTALMAQDKHVEIRNSQLVPVKAKWEPLYRLAQEGLATVRRLKTAGYDVAALEFKAEMQLLTLQMSDDKQRRGLSQQTFARLAELAEKLPEPTRTVSGFEVRLKEAAYQSDRKQFARLREMLFGESGLLQSYAGVQEVAARYGWKTDYLGAELYFLTALHYVKTKGMNSEETREYAEKAYAICQASSSFYLRELLPILIFNTTGVEAPERAE